MPVPVLRNKVTTAIGSAATSFAVTMPTHVAGDLLVVIATADGAPTLTTSSTGWVKLDGSTNYAATAVFAKVATSAAETLTVASTASEQYRATGWAFSDHSVSDVTTLETARAFADTSGAGEVPGITVSKPLSYYLIAALGGESGGSTAASNFTPTGVTSPWSNFQVAQATSTSDAMQATADTTLVGPTTLAPGTWTRSTGITRGYFSSVVAIPGAPDIPPSSGTVTVVSAVSGSVTLSLPVSGSVNVVTASVGAPTKQSPAAGAVAADSVVAGSAEVIAKNQASGAVTASSVVAGTLSVSARATASVTAVSTVVGAPFKITTASAAVTATSVAAATVRLRRYASGDVVAFSSVRGALKMIEAPDLPPTVLMRPEASLTVAGKTLAAIDGDAALDAARVPYAMATVEVAVTNPATVEAIDPRQGVRAVLSASNAGVSSRTFNLGVRERTIDHAAKTMKLELASDEAMLIDYAPITQDLGAFEMQNSLRSIVNYVLGKVVPGASLQAGGAPDQQFLVATDSTNLFPDPRYERTPEGGYAILNADTIPDTTWAGTENLAGVHLYNPTNDDACVQLSNNNALPYGIQVGRSYTFSATGAVRSAMGGSEQTARSRRLVVVGRVNGTYTDLARSAAVPTSIDGGTRVSVAFTVPEGCDQILLRAYHGHTSGTITWRAFRLSESHDYPGPHNWQYFDGSRPSDGLHAYSWTGTPNASTSKRVALIDRAPELLAWEPGVSAWDFLAPIVTNVGLKLWCDENRVWRLIDPAEYALPGVLSVTGFNATEGTDTITRSDPEVYCTGVIVKYRWRDTSGTQREALDSAGVAGSVLTIDFDRPYPGPGAAAAILNRRAGQGRVQEVTALSDYSATPGMEARITLPSTADQQGVLTSVSWSLTEGLMQVGTKGLLDLQKGSINALTGTIDQLTGTIDNL